MEKWEESKTHLNFLEAHLCQRWPCTAIKNNNRFLRTHWGIWLLSAGETQRYRQCNNNDNNYKICRAFFFSVWGKVQCASSQKEPSHTLATANGKHEQSAWMKMKNWWESRRIRLITNDVYLRGAPWRWTWKIWTWTQSGKKGEENSKLWEKSVGQILLDTEEDNKSRPKRGKASVAHTGMLGPGCKDNGNTVWPSCSQLELPAGGIPEERV